MCFSIQTDALKSEIEKSEKILKTMAEIVKIQNTKIKTFKTTLKNIENINKEFDIIEDVLVSVTAETDMDELTENLISMLPEDTTTATEEDTTITTPNRSIIEAGTFEAQTPWMANTSIGEITITDHIENDGNVLGDDDLDIEENVNEDDYVEYAPDLPLTHDNMEPDSDNEYEAIPVSERIDGAIFSTSIPIEREVLEQNVHPTPANVNDYVINALQAYEITGRTDEPDSYTAQNAILSLQNITFDLVLKRKLELTENLFLRNRHIDNELTDLRINLCFPVSYSQYSNETDTLNLIEYVCEICNYYKTNDNIYDFVYIDIPEIDSQEKNKINILLANINIVLVDMGFGYLINALDNKKPQYDLLYILTQLKIIGFVFVFE